MAVEVKAKASLDSTGFHAGVNRMKGSVDGMKAKVADLKQMLTGLFSVWMIKRFTQAVLSASAAFEDLTVQFRTLLGSQEKAVAHMEELAKFSAVTPFQIEGIADASQQLIVFTEGALGGTASLKLFGDAAAATGNKDLANLTHWVGRLYAALQADEPIKRSINALARMKVVAPSTMIAIKELQDAGASGSEIWRKFTDDLKKFEGGMERMSKTSAGKFSTMKDNWRIALKDMGDGMSGFTKRVLTDLTEIARGWSVTTKGFVAFWAAAGAASVKGTTSMEAWQIAAEQANIAMTDTAHDFQEDVGDMADGVGKATDEVETFRLTIKKLWEEGPAQTTAKERWRALGNMVADVREEVERLNTTSIEAAGAFFGGGDVSRMVSAFAASQRKRMEEGRWQDEGIFTDAPRSGANKTARDLEAIATATKNSATALQQVESNTRNGGLG